MRGEHWPPVEPTTVITGSSPHARGAPVRAHPHRSKVRIIPACAGSTGRGSGPAIQPGDHPRMRGEHTLHSLRATAFRGSSPHARGAQEMLHFDRRVRGIIPACAGSTDGSKGDIMAVTDHPRMRGEHSVAASSVLCAVGSSPHARGAPMDCACARLRIRIIPACAGSTRAARSRRLSPSDHPRMRGEHLLIIKSI